MENSDERSPSPNRDVDLLEFARMIWEDKRKILCISVLFLIFSAAYAIMQPDIYRAEALLVPNINSKQDSALSSIAGQFGGIASIAGISLNNNGLDRTTLALEILQSREFLYEFITSNDLCAKIFAAVGWSKEVNQLKYDEVSLSALEEGKCADSTKFSNISMLSIRDKFVDENLILSKDKDSGLIKIAVEHYSPFVAKDIVDSLITSINLKMKKDDIKEASRSIEYLENELETTSNSGAQTMFYQLIEKQYQTLMLAKVRDDYVFKLLDKPVVPEKHVKPQRLLVIFLGTMLGVALSIAVTLFSRGLK